MLLSQQNIEEILRVHNTLWDALYSNLTTTPTQHSITYNDETYSINIPSANNYASAVLPNTNGVPFLWITQNLNKPSYGTLAIERHAKSNNDHRITWIIDTRNGGFKYKFNISTTYNDTGNLIDGIMERYDDYGTSVVWSTNSLLISKPSEF